MNKRDLNSIDHEMLVDLLCTATYGCDWLEIITLKSERFRKMMKDMSGYEVKTSFYGDFTIAEAFGEKSVRDTYKRCFESWKDDYEYITELYLVLNHKIWELYEVNESLAKVYDELWRNLGCWCEENFTKDELRYFYQTID